MYGFLGLLCAELVSVKTCALFFSEEHVFMRNAPALVKLLRSGQVGNPNALVGDPRPF
jgi:hypothetical protein